MPGFINDVDLKPYIIPAQRGRDCESNCYANRQKCRENCKTLSLMCHHYGPEERERCERQVEDCWYACDGSFDFCMQDCRWIPWWP